MRKAFNFYRSYYDVMLQLPEEEQLAYIKAILTRQFTGEELELEGMAKFAYISQKHSIDQQVKGYETKMNTPLTPPTQPPAEPPSQGPTVPPSGQEKEKGKEKGKGKEQEKEYAGAKLDIYGFEIGKNQNVCKCGRRKAINALFCTVCL
jgi:hypothetical protein